MKDMVDNYKSTHVLKVDETVDSILNPTVVNTLKYSFIREIGR